MASPGTRRPRRGIRDAAWSGDDRDFDTPHRDLAGHDGGVTSTLPHAATPSANRQASGERPRQASRARGGQGHGESAAIGVEGHGQGGENSGQAAGPQGHQERGQKEHVMSQDAEPSIATSESNPDEMTVVVPQTGDLVIDAALQELAAADPDRPDQVLEAGGRLEAALRSRLTDLGG